MKWHAGPLTSSRLSPVGVIHLSLGIKQTDNPTSSQTLRDFLAISLLSSADVAGLHFFLFVNMIYYHSLWFIINNMARVNVHVVQHVAPPTFSLAVLLRNKPNDEWTQPCIPPSTASEVEEHYSDICCFAKLNKSPTGLIEQKISADSVDVHCYVWPPQTGVRPPNRLSWTATPGKDGSVRQPVNRCTAFRAQRKEAAWMWTWENILMWRHFQSRLTCLQMILVFSAVVGVWRDSAVTLILSSDFFLAQTSWIHMV